MDQDYVKYLSSIKKSNVYGSFVENSTDIFEYKVDVKFVDDKIVEDDIQVGNALKSIASNNTQGDTITVDQDYLKYVSSINRNDNVCGSFVENSRDVFDNNVDVNCADERTVISDIEVEEVDQDYVKFFRAYGSDFGDDTAGVEPFDVKPSADCNNPPSMPLYNGDFPQKTLNNTIQVDPSLYDKCRQKYISSSVGHNDIGDDGGSVRSVTVTVGLADVDVESVDGNNVDAKSIDNCLDLEMDPNYKMFLENLRLDGNHYVVDVSLQRGISKLNKYEEVRLKCDTADNLDIRVNKNTKVTEACRISDRVKAEELNSSVSLSSEEEIGSPRTLPRHKKRSPDISYSPPNKRSDSLLEMDGYMERSDPDLGWQNVRSNVGYGSETIRSAKFERKHEEEVDEIDESYQVFLDCLERNGENVQCVTTCDESVRVEEEDQKSQSDVEIIMMDNVANCIDLTADNYEGVPFTCSSWFEEGLIAAIEKPYDQKEFYDLHEEIYLQRPMEKLLDLRNGVSKKFSLNRLGKSYADEYSDLAREFKLVEHDLCKALSLLRGFLHWFQNYYCHEGVPPLHHVLKLVIENKYGCKTTK